MANVIVTLKVMPESPEVDLEALEKKAKELIIKFAGETEVKVEIEPVAFGLKSMSLLFAYDEAKGTTDDLEMEIQNLEGAQSVECTDARRAIG